MTTSENRTKARRAKIDSMRAKDRRKDTRRRSLMATLAVVAAFVLVAVAFVFIERATSDPADTLAAGESRYVRADSHRLQTAPDGKVTLVEFLDFECEACLSYFPLVESLREQYEGKVTFVARYFPIPSHFNAERAARAVEASAQQGRFDDMYKKMYETQKQWGEKRVPADPLFRGFAEEMGLDMAAWDKAYDDPATLARVKKDVADGEALGVGGTPTFFLNEKKIQPQSEEEFKAAIDAALAG
ncbi:DsbA family protein [Herbidospora cretacea]|uniref:DsbA family protein n=1 Tax=Herbidospora cretacea TaxID=28444 RepID=UPI0004C36F3B|nr:thioredoxin domain-containing protein [Herbidospora cretacea]